jgi:hypothetical protein
MFFPFTHADMHAVAANASGVTPSRPSPTSRSTAVAAAPRFAHSLSFVVVSFSILISSLDAIARVARIARVVVIGTRRRRDAAAPKDARRSARERASDAVDAIGASELTARAFVRLARSSSRRGVSASLANHIREAKTPARGEPQPLTD